LPHLGAAGWLNELIAESLVVALAGIPPLVFWSVTLSGLRRGDWRRLGRWWGGSLLIAAVVAAVLLGLDRRYLLPGERYAWDGWYAVWFAGVYLAGLFGLFELAWQTALRYLSARRPRRPPQTQAV
jgi:hypothetical protein